MCQPYEVAGTTDKVEDEGGYENERRISAHLQRISLGANRQRKSNNMKWFHCSRMMAKEGAKNQ